MIFGSPALECKLCKIEDLDRLIPYYIPPIGIGDVMLSSEIKKAGGQTTSEQAERYKEGQGECEARVTFVK